MGAYGVNFHDNDLIPIDANLKAFKEALADTGVVVPMAATNLFREPVLMDESKGPYSAGKVEALKAAAFAWAGLGERVSWEAGLAEAKGPPLTTLFPENLV